MIKSSSNEASDSFYQALSSLEWEKCDATGLYSQAGQCEGRTDSLS